MEYSPPSLEYALKVAEDVFNGAAERDIYTGDELQVFVIQKEGVECRKISLRKD